MNSLKNAIIAMEKRGAPILGMTAENAKGERKEYDIQMNPRTARWVSDKKLSNTLYEWPDRTSFLFVDRNKAKALRELKPEMSAEEAARNSVYSVDVNKIRSLRYMGVEIATS